MTTKVQVIQRHGSGRSGSLVDADQGDHPDAAQARVHLKLAASAYHEAGHRQDSGDRIVGMALGNLVNCALAYYVKLNRLHQEQFREMIEAVARASSGSHIDHAVARLQVQALACASTRHGIDACAELTRSAVGVLCQAAVNLAQVALGISDLESSYEASPGSPGSPGSHLSAPALPSGRLT